MRPRKRPCTGAPPPHSYTYARPFPCGWRCAWHTPSAVVGEPEPPPGPGWPAGAWTTPSPDSASAVFDEAAVASGKRRSSPHTYQAARAAVASRKDPKTT